jgi:histidine triad (HIT) family protein
MDNCIFCKIIKKQIPAQIIFENDHIIGFRDINPQAPYHFLAIPKTHYAGVHQVPPSESALFAHLFESIGEIVKKEGLDEKGYRLVVNFGDKAGQTVHHIHVHIIGGREMKWPPG